MDYVLPLLSLFLVHILALASPGPNLLVVTQTSVSQGRRFGVFVAIGLATGAAIWSTAAIVGLGLAISHLGWLYGAVRFSGGCYLLYLGIRLWRAAEQEMPTPAEENHPSIWIAYQLGLLTTMTNPKAAIFFGGVFAAILPAGAPAWVSFLAIVLVVVDSTVFHVGLALFFSTGSVKAFYARVKKHVDRFTGAALGMLGLRLLLGNR